MFDRADNLRSFRSFSNLSNPRADGIETATVETSFNDADNLATFYVTKLGSLPEMSWSGLGKNTMPYQGVLTRTQQDMRQVKTKIHNHFVQKVARKYSEPLIPGGGRVFDTTTDAKISENEQGAIIWMSTTLRFNPGELSRVLF
tara:strand:+ start:340 stop:771 length:432 start_codon:yes stop_codon:yes gene_type:complete